MIKPLLNLAPHELEPERLADYDQPAFAFRGQWFGQERDFVGQVVGQAQTDMIFFALADEPERGNFVSAMKWVGKATDEAQPISQPGEYIIPDRAQAIVEQTTQCWGRVYFLDEDLNLPQHKPVRWRLFLASSGWGEWCQAPNIFRDSTSRATFIWSRSPDASHMATSPPLELLARLQPELRDPNNDAAHARAFVPLDKRERDQRTRPVARGSYGEWEDVLRLFLLSRVRLWEHEGERASFRLNDQAASPARIVIHKHKEETNARRFYEITCAYFQPTPDADFLDRCSAAAAHNKRSFLWLVDAQRPTQHERMEALLQLRDWLEGKAAPDEIERLLSED